MRNIICEKCGHKMESYHEGSKVGFKCPNCGFILVTADKAQTPFEFNSKAENRRDNKSEK